MAQSGRGAYSVCTENFINHATNEEVASWCQVYTATIPMTSGTTDAREAFDLDFTGTAKSLWTSHRSLWRIVFEDRPHCYHCLQLLCFYPNPPRLPKRASISKYLNSPASSRVWVLEGFVAIDPGFKKDDFLSNPHCSNNSVYKRLNCSTFWV